MIDFFVFRKNHRKVVSMIKFIKKKLEIEESLKQRIMIICDFCNTTSTIINGSIRKIGSDMKMDTYNPGVIYVKEDNGTLLKNDDDVFKYIPAECDCNVVYNKEPIFIEIKPAPYYEYEETEEVSSK